MKKWEYRKSDFTGKRKAVLLVCAAVIGVCVLCAIGLLIAAVVFTARGCSEELSNGMLIACIVLFAAVGASLLGLAYITKSKNKETEQKVFAEIQAILTEGEAPNEKEE